MDYCIRIEETIGKSFIVEAESQDAAIEAVEEACNNGDIYLDEVADFIERNIYPSTNSENAELLTSFPKNRNRPVINPRFLNFRCPRCNAVVGHFQHYCDQCGKKLDWQNQ